jgi:hypothetical protein
MLHCSLLSLGCVFGFAPQQQAPPLTALRALKIAQRRLRPEVRSRLLSVTSSKSRSLVPEAWRFVFFDPGTSDKSRVVTVAAHTSSEHPDTVEAFSDIKIEPASALQVVPQNRWLVDSDLSLEKVREQVKLRRVRAAQYRLDRPRSTSDPVWLIEFSDDHGTTLGSFRVDARSGELSRMAVAA